MTRSVRPYEALAGYGERLDAVISDVYDSFAASLPEYSELAGWALEQGKQYTLRPSKRVRGGLVAAAYDQATNQQYSAAGLRLGAAIEIVQNYLLIVDDVIDRSVARRGAPTIHKLYQQYSGSDEREADMIGILVGELQGQLVNHAIATIEGVAADDKLRVMQMLARDLTITDLAQMDDVWQQFGVREVTEADLLRKYEQKSSYYSFVNPLTCGLVLAGKSLEQVRADAESFGLPAGIAFQLRDDYLGAFGDTGQTGKPNLDDLREGKNTLMVHLAAIRGTDEQKKLLGELLGNEVAGEDDLHTFQQILIDTNADVDALTRAEQYMGTAAAAARGASSWSSEFGDMLAGLVEFSVRRTA